MEIPESQLKREEATAKRFKCRERQMLPTDLIGFDINHCDENIKISLGEYLKTKGKLDSIPGPLSKAEIQREMTEAELKQLRINFGKLFDRSRNFSTFCMCRQHCSSRSKEDASSSPLYCTSSALRSRKADGCYQICAARLQDNPLSCIFGWFFPKSTRQSLTDGFRRRSIRQGLQDEHHSLA